VTMYAPVCTCAVPGILGCAKHTYGADTIPDATGVGEHTPRNALASSRKTCPATATPASMSRSAFTQAERSTHDP
jgi:hypothetical protein